MAKVEVRSRQTDRRESQSSPQADLVVGLPGLVDVAHVRSVAAQWSGVGRRITVVHPCVPGMSEALERLGEIGRCAADSKRNRCRCLPARHGWANPPVYAACWLKPNRWAQMRASF